MKNSQKKGFAITIIIAIVALLAIGGGVYLGSKGPKNINNDNSNLNSASTTQTEVKDNQPEATKNKTGLDISSQFPKESIASITGLNIVSAEAYQINDTEGSGCRYRYAEKNNKFVLISISKYNTDVAKEKQKYGVHPLFKGWRISTNNEISMGHFITYNEVGQLSEIYLLPEPNVYYKLSLYALKALTGQQIVNLAAKLASQI